MKEMYAVISYRKDDRNDITAFARFDTIDEANAEAEWLRETIPDEGVDVMRVLTHGNGEVE